MIVVGLLDSPVNGQQNSRDRNEDDDRRRHHHHRVGGKRRHDTNQRRYHQQLIVDDNDIEYNYDGDNVPVLGDSSNKKFVCIYLRF
jgi:hypothetical protein